MSRMILSISASHDQASGENAIDFTPWSAAWRRDCFGGQDKCRQLALAA